MREYATPGTVITSVRILSFWAAITLPFLYLPLLLTGIETEYETVAFLGLLALNVITLLGGRAYRP